MSSRYDGALAAALQTFFVEAAEMVEQMEQSLLELEQSPGDPELLNALQLFLGPERTDPAAQLIAHFWRSNIGRADRLNLPAA